jgi:hypothetical protein
VQHAPYGVEAVGNTRGKQPSGKSGPRRSLPYVCTNVRGHGLAVHASLTDAKKESATVSVFREFGSWWLGEVTALHSRV